MSRLLLIALASGLIGCTPSTNPWSGTPPGQTKVLASFPPVYCFAVNVAKDKARVQCLLTGTGPHDYEASPKDAAKVAGADVFLLNGIELEKEFAKRLVRIARASDKNMVEAGDVLDKKSLIHVPENKRDHGDHQHGEYDPHIWLGLTEAIQMVNAIAKTLGDRDPAHKSEYEKNAAEYTNKLAALQAYGAEKFAGKKSTAFITQHESLGYFARTWGLDLVDSIQPKPGVEADAKKLAELVEACKKKNVTVIAVEPQYSRGQADTLARALKERGLEIQVVEIDPIETATPGAGGNPSPDLYLDRMKANIDALSKAFP